MEPLTYVAQISLYWLLLYACYALLLRRHTFFGWNRAYLLGALLLSFALPLVQYPEASTVLPTVTYAAGALPALVSAPAPFVVYAQSAAKVPSWEVLLGTLYAAGIVFMLARLVLQFRVLFSFFQKGERIPMEDYTLILLDDDQTGSFSFMKWIVINRTDYAENLDTILSHELAHVRQRHSWDILLVEVLRVVFWFNPVLILYKKSLQQVHEYLADRETALPRDRYASFLVEYAFQTSVPDLTNQFFTSSFVKNRIIMLYKNKNSNWALGKYAAVVVLVGFVSLLMAFKPAVVQSDMPQNDTLSIPSESTIAKLEEMIVLAGVGDTRFGKYIPNLFSDEIPLKKEAEQFRLHLLNAETTTVKGTVRSSKTKELLPGANVILAGTSRGATTDANGAFELKEVPLDNKLAISYVGYDTRVVEVTKKNQAVNVVLAWQQNVLQNVVVVSYSPITGLKPESGADSTPSSAGKDGFTVVEQMPEFPGGVQEMYKFLGRNIKYPTDAVRNDVEGKVVISFTVSEKGRIRDPQVTQRLGDGTDEEALRVVLNMPSWKPAKQNGRPVAMEYVLPIEFKLEKPESKEDKEKRQGKAENPAKFFNYNKSELGDFGSPEGIRNFGAPTVSLPTSVYSSMKRYNPTLPSDLVFIQSDSTKKARFFNGHNPYIKTKN